MDSLAFKTLLIDFQKGLQRTSEDIESAADGDIEGDEKARAILAAKAKLQEYANCIEVLANEPAVLRQQFVDQFAYDLDNLRSNLVAVGETLE